MEHQPHAPDDKPRDSEQQPIGEVPIDGTPLERVSAYLRITFADADARGEAITSADAQAVATLLAPLLGPNSALARFADAGDADPEQIRQECQQLKAGSQQRTDIGGWIDRLEQHIASTPPSTEHGPPDDLLHHPQVDQGIREHGDAFRAYLQLPDIDRHRGDLLATFHGFYVGSFTSMDALLNELTEIGDWEHALDQLAGQWGIEGLVSLDRDQVERVARQTWDIVETGGQFHVFTK